MRQRGGDGTDEGNALEFRGDVEVQQKASGEGWRLRTGVAGRRGEESGRSVGRLLGRSRFCRLSLGPSDLPFGHIPTFGFVFKCR